MSIRDEVMHVLREQLRVALEREGDRIVVTLYLEDDMDEEKIKLPSIYGFCSSYAGVWQEDLR